MEAAILEQNCFAKGAGRLFLIVSARWAQPYAVHGPSGLWFNMCKHLLQAPGCTLVQEGLHSPTREQCQKISCCLHFFSVLQGHRLVCDCWFAWLTGSPAFLEPLVQAGPIRLKNRPYTKTRGWMPCAVAVQANPCMWSLLCIVFAVPFFLYSLFFLSVPQEMLSVGCSLVP